MPKNWKFILFVAGHSTENQTLTLHLRQLCAQYTECDCEVEVIDIDQHPEAVKEYALLVVPTILRVKPAPARKVIGDFSKDGAIVEALGLSTPPASAS